VHRAYSAQQDREAQNKTVEAIVAEEALANAQPAVAKAVLEEERRTEAARPPVVALGARAFQSYEQIRDLSRQVGSVYRTQVGHDGLAVEPGSLQSVAEGANDRPGVSTLRP
jgi:hypothetical protein